jgi:hypothetical protein
MEDILKYNCIELNKDGQWPAAPDDDRTTKKYTAALAFEQCRLKTTTKQQQQQNNNKANVKPCVETLSTRGRVNFYYINGMSRIFFSSKQFLKNKNH